MNKLLTSFVIFYISIAGSSSIAYGEKSGPLWLIQMGNRDNSAQSSRAMISYNGMDLNNLPQHLTEKMMNCLSARTAKNSLLPLVELNGQYYYFEKYFKANYFKASHFCKEHGMELLSIETSAEYMEIITYLKKNYPKIDHLWTSGTDAGEEGTFVWFSTGRTLNYTNWGQGLPDNAGKVENCLEIYKAGVDNYLWNDRICSTEYNFICEVKE